MDKSSIIKFSFRLVPSFLIILFLCWTLGDNYVKGVLPVISWQIQKIHPDYEIRKFFYNHQRQIQYEVRIHRKVVMPNAKTWDGKEVEGGVMASALCIQPLIVFSLLLAWPKFSLPERLKAILVSIILLMIFQPLDIPFHIINRLEAWFPSQSLAAQVRGFWVHFLNSGGRQVLGLVVFIISLASVAWKRSSLKGIEIKPNDPCPCGSGKKYKKCCME